MAAYTQTIKRLLLVAGTTEILLGLAHLIMPGLIYQSPGFQQLSSRETDMVTLCVFSVGILLIAAGVISLICCVKYERSKEISLFITLVLTLLWFIRMILELLFPVKIPLLFMDNPTQIILPVLIVLCSILASTVFLMLKDKRQ